MYKVILGLVLLVASLVFIFKLNTKSSPSISENTPTNFPEKQTISSFSLYTRVTPNTWPKISKFAKEGDVFWGPVEEVPKSMRALTISNYDSLVKRTEKESLEDYSAINWDSEGKDFNKEYEDALKIRKFIDSYNTKNNTSIKFIAFFHLNIIDANPDIVSYPDIILVGKTSWNSSNIIQESEKYINIIKNKDKIPGILLGEKKSDESTRTKISHTQNEVRSNFDNIISPDKLDLNIVGFYYDQDKADSLIKTLEELRPEVTN